MPPNCMKICSALLTVKIIKIKTMIELNFHLDYLKT